MKNLIIALSFFCIINSSTAQENQLYSYDQLIVKIKPEYKDRFVINNSRISFDHPRIKGVFKNYPSSTFKKTGNLSEGLTYLIQFKNEVPILETILEFKQSDLFEFIEPNYIGYLGGQRNILPPPLFPNDQHFKRQWALHNDGSFHLSNAIEDADIDMELAWEIETGSENIIVAVLDSGIKIDHPDFEGRIWINPNENFNGSDTDDNGYVDDINGWDFVNIDNNPKDDHGHGTNVAGIIGAKPDNSIGYAGVDWNCKIMDCKVINSDNFGYYSWWTEAIYYAVNNGAQVINMSLGGSSFSNIMQEAVNYAYNNGVIVVASMMNFNNDEFYYPASYANTIAVGSTDSDDNRSAPFFWDATSGSNYGGHIDVVAPGNYIYGLAYNSNSNYNSYWGGTSQAAPMVSGLCALLLSQDPSRSPDDIREIIRDTAEDMVGDPSEDKQGFDIYYGYGRINAYNALNQLDVSSKDIRNDYEFQISPNPASEIIRLAGDISGTRIVICTTTGTDIRFISTTSSILDIDISTLNQGIYYLKVFNEDNKLLNTKPFIKL